MDALQVPKIGEILVKEKLTEESAIQKALDQQKSSGAMLGDILVNSNIISQKQLKKALQIQFRHKLAIAVLSFITTRLEAKSINDSGHLELVSKDKNKPLPYKITYGNKDVYFTEGEALISDVEASKGNKKIETKELKITPEMMGNIGDDYLSDTLTLVVVAK